MPLFRLHPAALAVLCALSASALATEAPLSADAYVSTTAPAANYGATATLNVGAGASTLLRFDLSALPDRTLPANVLKANLLLYVNRVGMPGSIEVLTLGSAWSESAVTAGTVPATERGTSAATAAITSAGQYIAVDVTDKVMAWIAAGNTSNFGFVIRASAGDPSTMVFFDSKENTGTGHAARLDLTMANQGQTGQQGLAGLPGLPGLPGPPGATTGVLGPAGPQGPFGLKGDAGAAGPIGATGSIGPIGPIGPVGLIGTAGATGLAGLAGAQGLKGDSGVTGAVGLPGAMGATGSAGMAGATGSPGAAGATGISGAVGPAGSAGTAGTAGAAGPAGVAGLAGLTGAQGLKGDTGLTGASGASGATGATGTVGSTGTAGAMGVAGATGATGSTGTAGAKGTTGVAGAMGPAGPSGASGAAGTNGAAGAGVTWVNVTGTTQLATSNTGYMANSTSLVSITLPAAPVLGDILQVNGVGTGRWTIIPNSGQSLITQSIPGNLISTVGPISGAQYSAIALQYIGNNTFTVLNYAGLVSSYPPAYVLQGGLTWMPVSNTAYNFANASVLCSGPISGRTGWRLPTQAELIALYNSGAMKDHGWTLTFTWSSSLDSSGAHYNYSLNHAADGVDSGASSLWVTCVR